MKKHIAIATECKDNIAQASHGDALRAFYGRMASSQGPDHPWMLELAGIICAHEDAESENEILIAIDKIDLAIEIIDDLMKLAFAKCAAVDNMGEAQSAILAARRYARDVREQTAFISAGAAS